jgi:hypothetical protein
MPAVAYHAEDNHLFKALRRKEKQLPAVPAGTLRCILLGDVGCRILRELRPVSVAEVNGDHIIRHFLARTTIDVIGVVSPHRSGNIPMTRFNSLAWSVIIYDRRASKYGEGEQIAEQAGVEYGTIFNYASVANAFEFSRRRENLTFTHHQEVARLTVRQQDKWLDQVEKNDWSCMQMRAKIRQAEAVARTRAVELDAAALGKFVVLYASRRSRVTKPVWRLKIRSKRARRAASRCLVGCWR